MNRASLVAWWQSLAQRERALVGGGAALLLAVVVYLMLWEPPAQGIRKLQADLPELRSQDATMRAMAAEAASLRSVDGRTATIAPAERVAAVRRSLLRAGLWRERAADAATRSSGPSAGATVAGTMVSTLSVAGTVTTVSTAAPTRVEPPEITAEADDRVRVRFDDIDYGVWVAWLASTEAELSARASKVSIVALAPRAPVGHVRAEALLDWTQPSASPRS